MNQNLLMTKPIAHRHLYNYLEDNTRTPKAEFFLEDLWNYYNLCFLGKNDVLSSFQFTTIETIEKRKRALLSDIAPMLPKQEELLLKLVKTYGVEVVLYAIDEFSGGSSDGVPDVDNLIYYMKGAAATLASIQLRRQLG